MYSISIAIHVNNRTGFSPELVEAHVHLSFQFLQESLIYHMEPLCLCFEGEFEMLWKFPILKIDYIQCAETVFHEMSNAPGRSLTWFDSISFGSLQRPPRSKETLHLREKNYELSKHSLSFSANAVICHLQSQTFYSVNLQVLFKKTLYFLCLPKKS